MSIDPISASERIIDKYLRYIETTFYIDQPEYMSLFKEHLSRRDFFAQGPYLDINDSFLADSSIRDLIDRELLSREFLKLYQHDQGKLTRKLYRHQEKAIKSVKEENNTVVTTGTGSGKTESFLIPVLDYLMEQKLQGQLTDGVRALLIYPMNALANDQLKRLRELLKDYPDITFGTYTGETLKGEEEAIERFRRRTSNWENPLPNERLSREMIKSKPPHILITNYAMLEYLMLRPEDNVFFHGDTADNWKFIILDEAHTYSGATGIEVSMLLRRVLHSLKNPEDIQFILTSATLGGEDSNHEICDFASRLCCDAPFSEKSIIRAERYNFIEHKNTYSVDPVFYSLLKGCIENNSDVSSLVGLRKEHAKDFPEISEGSLSEWLYTFLLYDEFYYRLRTALREEPLKIKDLALILQISESDLVAFVFAASRAEKNNVALLDARYHLFLRALEGTYVTLGETKKISILPEEHFMIGEEVVKSFRISVCQYCGHMYVEGSINSHGVLEQTEKDDTEKETKYFIILDESEQELSDDEDDLEGLSNNENVTIYTLCGKCGSIENEDVVSNSNMCNCSLQFKVRVAARNEKKKTLNKCLSCGLINTQGSILRQFYLGQDAASSVLATSLYEEIPSHKVMLTEEIDSDGDSDFLGTIEDVSRSVTVQKLTEPLTKQMLVFSDSRQQAAYFASYFSFTYNNISRRKILMEAIERAANKASDDKVTIQSVYFELVSLFNHYQIIDTESQQIEKEAWKTILYEISSNDRNSLENLGLIAFEYDAFITNKMGGFQQDDAITIQKFLVNSFRRDCMFDYPERTLMNQKDREYFQYKGSEVYMTLESDKEEKKKNKGYLKSWIGRSNNRINYLKKTKDMTLEESRSFLENFWAQVLVKQPNSGLVLAIEKKYLFDINKFNIRSTKHHNIKWYQCDLCRKITVNNIENNCPSYHCSGSLNDYDPSEEVKNDHYRKMYTDFEIYPMKIKEHTAQLSPDKARQYQNQFIEGFINILSCSTTFELGVDVGELETVFMRNMPPSPANYIQRAGRAGRQKESAAFALTFCKLASHDLTYFNNPLRMIKGQILPPRFLVENEKIIQRHISAAIIASWWRSRNQFIFTVMDFFEKKEFADFMSYVNDLPEKIIRYLYDFVPEAIHSSVDEIIHHFSNKNSTYVFESNEYWGELEELDRLYVDARANSDSKSERYAMGQIEAYRKRLEEERIISFLSRKNLIPKYGFPVDSVELFTGFGYQGNKSLRLQRDLRIAISEYAPGSKIIADGNLYTSQYIKKPNNRNNKWRQYDYVTCANQNCGYINTKHHLYNNDMSSMDKCEICGEDINYKRTFLIPEYGFSINKKVELAEAKKPIKSYSGEIHYMGNKSDLKNREERLISLKSTDISLQTTTNDELLILNQSNFFICETCGFTEVIMSNFSNKMTSTHENPYGKKCSNNNLYRKSLGHTFKTDVVSIGFNQFLEKSYALSILYAMLEGISLYIDVERNDIAGTIHYIKDSTGRWQTRFILYDNVPGGAGHMRRVGEADEKTLEGILRQTYDIVHDCQCGKDSDGDSACYSCLCNYYNQKHHSELKRKYAVDFIEGIFGEKDL